MSGRDVPADRRRRDSDAAATVHGDAVVEGVTDAGMLVEHDQELVVADDRRSAAPRGVRRVQVQVQSAQRRGQVGRVGLAGQCQRVAAGAFASRVHHRERGAGYAVRDRQGNRDPGLDDGGQTVLTVDEHLVLVEGDALMRQLPFAPLDPTRELLDRALAQGPVVGVASEPLGCQLR